MDDRGSVESILAAWCEARDRGEPVDPDEVVRCHPECAADLRDRFRVLRAVDEIVAETTEAGEPRRIGDYRIVRELGRGGMGTIYEAQQTSMHRRVALKVLSPTVTSTPLAVKRFRREARAAGRLHHANIVPVYGMGEDRGVWFYAMELVRGRPLDRVVAEMRQERHSTRRRRRNGASTSSGRRRSEFARIAERFAGVADALEAAHAAGIIHRDVKPSNLILDDEGTLKLMDFGLARERASELTMTRTGDIVGTPAYMSPEQASARRLRIDHRTDVYSLGATIYEVLTLERPFRGTTLAEVCSQITSQDPTAPRRRDRNIPRDLETIVLKAMEKDPAKRYATAAAMESDLRLFAQGDAIRARRMGPVGRTLRRVRRRPVRAALVAGLLITAAAAGLFAMKSAHEAAERAAVEHRVLCQKAWEVYALGAPPGDHAGESARELFTRAIDLAPEHPEPYVGRALSNGALIKDRLADLEAAVARGFSARAVHLARSAILRGARRVEEAESEEALAAALPRGGSLEDRLEAQVHRRRGSLGEAEACLTRSIEGTPAGDAARYVALRWRAKIRRLQGNLEGAVQDLLALRSGGDRTAITLARLAHLRRLEGKNERARALFSEAVETARREGDEADWRGLCATVHRLREWDWFERATAAAHETLGDRPALLRPRVMALGIHQRHEEALRIAERWVASAPDDHEAHHTHAQALRGLGRDAEALEAIDQSLILDDTCPGAHSVRSDIVLAAGDLPGALEEIERALRLDPRHARHRAGRGGLLLEMGRLDEALAETACAIRLDPRDPDAQKTHATALASTGRDEEALAALDRSLALQRDPGGAEFLMRAMILHKLGRFPEALDSLDASKARGLTKGGRVRVQSNALGWIDAEPAYHNARAEALVALGRTEEALEDQQRVADLLPGNARALCAIGVRLVNLDRPAEALVVLAKALEIDPDLVVAHDCHIRGLIKQERLNSAFDAAKRLVADRPREDRAHAVLAAVHWERAEYEEALRALDEAIALAPDSARYPWDRAANLQGLRRFDDALRAMDESLTIDPHQSVRWNDRGVLLGAKLGRFDEAASSYRRAIALRPGKALYHLNLGAVLHRLAKHAEALQSVERALSSTVEIPLVPAAHHDAMLLRATSLVSLERPHEALSAYEKAITAHPGARDLVGHRASLLGALYPAEALRAVEEALAAEPDSARLHGIRGEILQGLERHDEALAAYGRALELDPRSAWHYYRRARVQHDLDRHAESLADIRRSLELRSDDEGPAEGHLLVCLGGQMVRLKQHEEAIHRLERALALEVEGRDLVFAHYWLGRALFGLRRFGVALDAFDRALALDPRHGDSLAERVRALFELGRFEDALEAVERALAVEPERLENLVNRGAVLSGLGRFEEALEVARRAARIAPDDAVNLANGIAALVNLGRLDEALAARKVALERHPQSLSLHHQMADLFFRRERFEEALEEFSRILALDVQDLKARWGRAVCLLRLGRQDEAFGALERTLKLSPDHADALYERGQLLRERGRLHEALTDLDRAVELKPDRGEAHRMRGVVLADLGQASRAVEALERAVALNPEDAQTQAHLSAALLLCGRDAESLAAARRAVELDPDSGQARYHLSITLNALGRREEALVEADRAIERSPEVARHRGAKFAVLLDMGKSVEALAEADRIVEMDPANDYGHVLRMCALEKAGRLEDALAACEEAIRRAPHLFRINFRKARLLRDLKRHGEALRHIEAVWGAGAEGTANPAIHRLRASTLCELGRLEEAAAAYDRVLAARPDDAGVLLSKAIILNNLRLYEEALATLDRLPAPEREAAGPLYVRAFALQGVDRYEESEQVARRILERAPEHGGALQILGRVHEELNRDAEALRSYERMAATGPMGRICLAGFLTRCADERLRDVDRAVRLCREVLRDEPRNYWARHCLGTSLYRLARWKESFEVLAEMERDGVDKSVGHRRFFLAMLRHRLGRTDEAREWYRKGVAWQREKALDSEGLEKLRKEAAELLGLDR